MVVILDTDPKSDVCPRSVCRPVASQVVPSTSLDCNLIASGVFCNSIRMNNLRVSVARFAEIYFPIGQSFTHDRPQEAQWCVRPEARDEAFFGVRCLPIWTARAAPDWSGAPTTAGFIGIKAGTASKRLGEPRGVLQGTTESSTTAGTWIGAVS